MGFGARRRKANDEKTENNSSFWCGSRFLAIIGALTVILVVAVVHVATSDEHKTYFDELLSTGGAIRSAREVRRSTREDGVCESEECKKIAKYINTSIDYSKDPCVDFYDFVCGGWIKANPIPKSSSTYSTFTKLNGHVEKSLRAILEEKGEEKDASQLLELPRNFYHSCMDLAGIQKKGDKPLKDLIKEIGSWSVSKDEPIWKEDKWDLENTLLFIHRNYTSAGGPLFSVHISDDPINNTRHIIEVSAQHTAKLRALCGFLF